MDALNDARDLVAERFAGAAWAMLTGSRNVGSDLDIVVMRADEPGFRESLRFRGWPVELFVHSPEGLAGILARDLVARKPTTHRMLATGTLLRGDAGDLPARCAAVLAAGPPPLTVEEWDRQRYVLTDLLDDYTHAADAGERAVITSTLWLEAARVSLACGGRWISGGKWLLRELREWDPARAEGWLAARDDPETFASEVLAEAGGALFEGYRVEAPSR